MPKNEANAVAWIFFVAFIVCLFLRAERPKGFGKLIGWFIWAALSGGLGFGFAILGNELGEAVKTKTLAQLTIPDLFDGVFSAGLWCLAMLCFWGTLCALWRGVKEFGEKQSPTAAQIREKAK